MSAWWTGIPASEAVLMCGGHRHTLRWAAGELIAVNHPDPEQPATRAGELAACHEVLRTWSRRREDPHVLTLASRGATDPLHIDADLLRFGSGPRRRTEQQTLRLLALGGRLPDRLQATTAAIWTRRLQTGHVGLDAARPQLDAALYGRVRRALRAWLGDPSLEVQLTMIEPGEQRRLTRTKAGIEVSLPFSWLSEVWARGLAVTLDRLCIAADTTDGTRWTLHTLDPDLTQPAELTITSPGR